MNDSKEFKEKETATSSSPAAATTTPDHNIIIPPLGPEPTLLNRKQIDALYETFLAIRTALHQLQIPYILTGGSLLGAIRQHSILFCDDDIDVTIIETSSGGELKNYQKLSDNLSMILGKEYMYTKRPWEGGDKVRPKRMSNIFVDIFTLREYKTVDEFVNVVGIKKNGLPQSQEYIHGIISTIIQCFCTKDKIFDREHNQDDDKNNVYENLLSTLSRLCPFWHFDERKAIEMWPKEIYRRWELFPLNQQLKFGPYVNITGPRMPIRLLKRAFGDDCFEVYYQSGSHTKNAMKKKNRKKMNVARSDEKTTDTDNAASNAFGTEINNEILIPIVHDGGNWSNATKSILSDEQYLPMQPISKAKRRYTTHNKQQLFKYLEEQIQLEEIEQ